MRIGSLGLGLVIASLTWLWADTAQAAPARRGGEGIHQGGYIFGSPGIIAIPIDEDNFPPDLDPTWQWSVNGGYLWTPTRLFKISFGGAFEHMIMNFEDPVDDVLDGNVIRFIPELRIGAGTERVWGYGLLGTGLAVAVYDHDFDEDESDPGFNLEIGGGVQGAVWRSLFLGGEMDFDLGFFDGGPYSFRRRDYALHTFGMKFIIGWYF